MVSLVAEFKRMVDNDVDRRVKDADESILSGAEHREWGRFYQLTAARLLSVKCTIGSRLIDSSIRNLLTYLVVTIRLD
jgi:hypothetical protein